ncbi:MAG TPA: hypothetical protein VGD64_12525, partial [Acidisarcina sp.]
MNNSVRKSSQRRVILTIHHPASAVILKRQVLHCVWPQGSESASSKPVILGIPPRTSPVILNAVKDLRLASGQRERILRALHHQHGGSGQDDQRTTRHLPRQGLQILIEKVHTLI